MVVFHCYISLPEGMRFVSVMKDTIMILYRWYYGLGGGRYLACEVPLPKVTLEYTALGLVEITDFCLAFFAFFFERKAL